MMLLLPMMRKTYCLILLLLLLMGACRSRHHHQITRAFYYWKTVYKPTPYEQHRLKMAGCQRLYLHCFDINTDPATHVAMPVAIVRLPDTLDAEMRYVPVVFITQYSLTLLSPAAVKPLAANINKLLTQVCRNMRADEVQIDCDWTASTRDVYFALLKALREEAFFKGKQLSCTIRLHQVKYRLGSGVPPVDRGLLMCYNMGNLKQPGNRNSILDVPLAKKYLGDVRSYPLPLDVALPLFSWCVQFRNDRMVGIIRDLQPEEVFASSLFRKEKEHLYTSTADTLWKGYQFRKGDQVRTESPADADILAMADYTAQQLRTDSLRVILFHCDSLTLAKHSADALEAIYSAYH